MKTPTSTGDTRKTQDTLQVSLKQRHILKKPNKFLIRMFSFFFKQNKKTDYIKPELFKYLIIIHIPICLIGRTLGQLKSSR